MKRTGFAIAAFVAIALIFLLVSAYGLMTGAYGPKLVAVVGLVLLLEGLFDALGNRFFWLFGLISLAALLVFAKRRKWSRLRTFTGALGWLAVAFVVTWVWLLLIYGPLFNFFAPLTGEFRVYHAECQGWVWRPSESIGGAGQCYGFYKWPGGRDTYKVDVPNQKVWIGQELVVAFEPHAGWVSLVQRSGDPSEKKTCEVRNYSNWRCTDTDRDGTTITSLVGGRMHSYEYRKPNPSSAKADAFGSLVRCYVQVDALTWWRLWPGPFGILGSRKVEAESESYSRGIRRPGSPDWIDCTKPPL